ncbi:glycosyltransferase [Faecalitalea cylindroides]|uniref:glycosyltransferase n=1 Tax=Faecalitalea cylindroides TaxID=39483 RepID=UPI00195C54A5|nr:glycosyltransferase [Faecalitalea cylindroides]MBM6653403.1 glycosyltransferase [Faecalitalea cylindroides]
MNETPVRILHFTTKLSAGGVQTFLLSYFNGMDSSKVIFDFVVQGNEIGEFEKKLAEKGSKIFHVTSINKSCITYCQEVYALLKAHPEYKIVHAHLNFRNILPLSMAKLAGVQTRISHSHSNYPLNKLKQKIQKIIFHFLIKIVATDYWTCSEQAGKWLYGKSRKTKVIHNAISSSNYIFSEDIRKEYRKKYSISNEKVWVNIGMFGMAKNHKFLIKLFKCYLNENPDTILILCGDGDLKKDIETDIAEYGIKDKVLMLGVVKNVQNYLMMADIMVMPSLFEGAPLVCVEAQATGCPVICSEAVPKEMIWNENVIRCHDWNLNTWITNIKNLLDIKINRAEVNRMCKENDFDINVEAKKLQKIYLKRNNSF